MTVTLTIQFADEDDLKNWVKTAFDEAMLNDDLGIGVARADMLDKEMPGRARDGQYVLRSKNDPRPGGWLVEPGVL